MNALTITIPAHELRQGDYIDKRGIVGGVHARGTVVVQIAGTWRILPREERVTVHLEDTGGEK